MENGKIIFVTGGVISSLGKGIIAASVARLLKDQGVNVNMMKCDPYLNVDPGTMSPIEHGEVFITTDGGETDLDIGHYERFLGQDLTSESSISSGKVYSEVLNAERNGDYLGKTVQIVPHITDKIKEMILRNTKGFDVLFVEIGGTVGDIESLPYLEAIRQLQISHDTFLIHGAYVPYLKGSKELKTKPVQHSVKELQGLGIRPNMIVTRNEIPLTDKEKQKISMFCNVDVDKVIESVDLPSVYEVPLKLKEQNVDQVVADYFNFDLQQSTHSKLKKVVDHLYKSTNEITVSIVGKYSALEDSYLSVIESIKHGAIENEVKVNIELLSAQSLTEDQLQNSDAIIVPGGFGESGIEGKLLAIKYARENNVPFLGICLGLQLSVIEFSKNVLNIDVEHQELNPNTDNPIIHLLEGQDLERLGGTQRLGSYDCQIKENTLAHKIYNKTLISERHRHRYEFNSKYKEILEQGGLVFSGINPQTNLVEIIENPNNDFFIAGQFHPEVSSKLTEPHPLFVSLIKHAIK